MRAMCLVVMTMLVVARPVHAERRRNSLSCDTCVHCEKQCGKEISTPLRVTAIVLTVFPGIFVRGIGSWVVGEPDTAKRLAIYGYGGLAVSAGPGALIGLTGANPYTTTAVPIVLVGAGGFLTSWLADLHVATGGKRRHARPRALSPWSLELGETWLHDAYRERLYSRVAARGALGRFDVGGAAMLDVGGDGWLGFADARVRLLGAAASDDMIDHGDRLWARVGGRVQHDDDDMVTQLVGELEVGGRLDLDRVDISLSSSFAEMSLGLGVLRATYTGEVSDVDSLMLARFAWGAYLPSGELTFYYDHRRDGLAGGIPAFRASGFVGSVGANLDVRVAGPWAIRSEIQVGNAWLTTLAFGYRGGHR